MGELVSFDNNIQVVHIGHLFRSSSHKEWRIFIWFNPMQKQKWTRFSHLPLLSRGKTLNRVIKRNNMVDHVVEFDASILQRAKLIEFPNLSPFASVLDKDGSQNSFIYETETFQSNIHYHIPQLELARSIFLINSYFCRSCLSSTALQQEFDVQYDTEQDHLDIQILPSSSFPKEALKHPAIEQFLAWLFSDQDVMDSYESIFKHYQKNREITKNGEQWCFSFDPPPMQGWKLHVKGRISNDGKNYLVEEIVGLEIGVKLPRTTRIIHDSFQENEAGSGNIRHMAVSTESVADDEELQLDDEATANIDTTTRVLESEQTWVSFSKPSKIEKSRKAQKNSQTTSEKEEMSPVENSNLVSTDEPILGGVLAAADVGGKQDATNYNQIFANRFAVFNELILILKTKFGCHIIFEETLVLPVIGRRLVHVCKDGSPRVIKAVGLHYDSGEFVLFEVDVSDGVKMLSTKILTCIDRKAWNNDFEKIRRGVVKNSLNWPNDLFDQLYGINGHREVNHPKGMGKLHVSKENIEGWAERVIRE